MQGFTLLLHPLLTYTSHAMKSLDAIEIFYLHNLCAEPIFWNLVKDQLLSFLLEFIRIYTLNHVLNIKTHLPSLA